MPTSDTTTGRASRPARSPLCKLHSYIKRNDSSWTSTSHVGQSKEDIFSSFNSDGSAIVEGYVGDGIWDQNTIRRLHNRGNQVPAFSVAHERRAVAPQPCSNLDRAACDLLLDQTRISISSRHPGPRRGTPGAIENHIAGRWHVIALQESVEHLQHDYVARQF